MVGAGGFHDHLQLARRLPGLLLCPGQQLVHPLGRVGYHFAALLARCRVQQQHTMDFAFVDISANEKHAFVPPVAG